MFCVPNTGRYDMNLSFQKKTILLIIVTVILISAGSIFYLGSTLSRLQNEENEKRARELANIIAYELDIDTLIEFKGMVSEAYDQVEDRISNDFMGTREYEQYVHGYEYLEHTEEFKSLYGTLRRLLDAADVDCFYLFYLDKPSKAMVYMVDAGENNICHPGSFDYLKGEDLEALNDPNRSIVPTITNQQIYGDVVGSGEPILDKNGEVIAYVGVDVSMTRITRQRNRLLLNTVLSIIVLALILSAGSLYVSGKIIVKPLSRHQEIIEESENLRKENVNLAKRAHAALKISDLTTSVEALLTNMPAMTFSKDVETGKYLACNQMFAEYARKKSPVEVIGLTDTEIFDHVTAEHFIQDDKIALSMNEPYILREDVPDAEGNMRYLQTTKLKFKDTSGRTCLLGMSVDVSELVMIKKENARTRDAYKQVMSEKVTYSSIARALAFDYSYIYYVELGEDHFKEYSASGGKLTVEVENEGEDFFNVSLKNARKILHPDDQDRFCNTFTKENVLKAIEEEGKFEIVYRHILDDVSTYMSMKAVMLEDDDKHLIIGISNIDTEIRARQAAERMQEEQTTYQRVAALAGKYIAIYTVDPKTDHFVEYSATDEYSELSLPKEGDDFFVSLREGTSRNIYDEDREHCIEALNKEHILSEIEKVGMFSIKYRLMLNGEPRYVRMRATLIEEKDGPQIILGVSDINNRMKLEKEYAENLALARSQANYDVLTGVMNKHAYVDNEARIDEMFEAGTLKKFAIVVCDINGLKLVNDTMGHKAGDELIKKAAKLITEIFVGGKVFRIGGDEFAVIFEGDLCKGIDGMMKKMQGNNAYNKDRGGVVVASGMAKYQKGDNTVEEVFQRADEAMYKNKELLKNGR
jgi:diguanylate cyclase (GGDEF)-like protein